MKMHKNNYRSKNYNELVIFYRFSRSASTQKNKKTTRKEKEIHAR